jgi:ribosomal protein S18 acetylase RimI-like enzyme
MSGSWQRVPPERWRTLATRLHAWNRRADGGVRCIHTDQGEDVAPHEAELAAMAPDAAAFWLYVDQRGEAVGLIGCEVDRALARGWLRGPLATTSGVLDAMRPSALALLDDALPEVRQWDAFPSADCAELNDWYAAVGFAPLQLHRVLQADLTGLAASEGVEADVRVATADDAADAWRLHGSLFPASYLAAAEFAGDGAKRTLFVVRDGAGALAGYLHAEDDPLSGEIYVDYLGVAAAGRGRGLGAALLRAAARWGAERGRSRVSLTVREDRPSALGLYARCGFAEITSGRHWQRKRA